MKSTGFQTLMSSILLQIKSLKSDCTREGRSTVHDPSPILTKIAPGERLGPKRNLATPFRPIRPIWPAQWPPKWPFLDFKKYGFLVKFGSLKPYRYVCYGFLVGF